MATNLKELIIAIAWVIFAGLCAYMLHIVVPAHSAGWSFDPAVQRWWQQDVVRRCCSLADGFEADEYESTQGGVWAIITDDGSPVCWQGSYDEETDTQQQVCRRELPKEKRFYVPQEKIIYEPRNPTGHGILFLLNNDNVMCYFLPSGA